MKEVKYFSLNYRYITSNGDSIKEEKRYFFDFHVLNSNSFNSLSKLDFSFSSSLINDYNYQYAYSINDILKDISPLDSLVSTDISYVGIVVPSRTKINVSYQISYLGSGVYSMLIRIEFSDNLKMNDND